MSGACSIHHRTCRGCVDCARPRRGDCRQRTSSDFDTRFGFFPVARAAAASDTAHLATLARLVV